MKRLLAVMVVCVALAATVPPRAAASGHVPEELLTTFADLWNAHNVDGMTVLWDPDGDIVYPYDPDASYVRGQEKIRSLLAAEHKGRMRKSTYTVGKPIGVRYLDPGQKYAVVDATGKIAGIIGMPDQSHRITVVMALLAKPKDEGRDHPRLWGFVGYRLMLPGPKTEESAKD